MAVRVWLNRNYATTVHVIAQLRDNPDGVPVEIFASHTDETSPVLSAADHVLTEPDYDSPDYVDEMLELCRRHHINVLLPVGNQLAIARRRAEFEAQGTALICPPAAAIELLDDKTDTYRSLGGSAIVPEWRVVNSAAAFDQALMDLSDEWTSHAPLVVKPARGVGADGVRFLTRERPQLAELLGPVGLHTHVELFRDALSAAEAAGETIPELMVMPYLPGPETSVDVLADKGRTIAAVPRSKVGRRRLLDGDPRLFRETELLVEHFELDGLVNVQFRTYAGRPVLLEINTRPSGGLFQTGLAGVNLPWAAVRLALGGRPMLGPVQLGAEYVTIATVVPRLSPAPVPERTPSRAALATSVGSGGDLLATAG